MLVAALRRSSGHRRSGQFPLSRCLDITQHSAQGEIEVAFRQTFRRHAEITRESTNIPRSLEPLHDRLFRLIQPEGAGRDAHPSRRQEGYDAMLGRGAAKVSIARSASNREFVHASSGETRKWRSSDRANVESMCLGLDKSGILQRGATASKASKPQALFGDERAIRFDTIKKPAHQGPKRAAAQRVSAMRR